MLSALRRSVSQVATLAGMRGLACDGATACKGTSSLHARGIRHLISLSDFKQQRRLGCPVMPILLPQPPSPASCQHHTCFSSVQQPHFAAAAMPQLAHDTADATEAAPSRRSRRSSGALPPGSSAEMAVVDRLQQLAFKRVQGATTDGAAAALERQPDRTQRSSDGSRSGSKRNRSKRRRGADKPAEQHSGAADRQQSPAALRPGKDPHAIRSPSLIRNGDIPSHAWAVMRTLKTAGKAAVQHCAHGTVE